MAWTPSASVPQPIPPITLQNHPSLVVTTSPAHCIFAQAIRRGSTTAMHRFDYGSDCGSAGAGPRLPGSQRRCNQEVYGQAEPPAYNFTQITTPLALFTGACRQVAGGHTNLYDEYWDIAVVDT